MDGFEETTAPIKPSILRRVEAAFLLYTDRVAKRTESICGAIEPDENYLVFSGSLRTLPPELSARFRLVKVVDGARMARERKTYMSFLELGAEPHLYRLRNGTLAAWFGCTAGFFTPSGEKRIYADHGYFAFEEDGRIKLLPTSVVDY